MIKQVVLGYRQDMRQNNYMVVIEPERDNIIVIRAKLW